MANHDAPEIYSFISVSPPIAKITSTLLQNIYRVLDFSGVFQLEDDLGNDLIPGDEVTISITTQDTSTYIGSATYNYGDNIFSAIPITSDLGFDTYIQPFFTGNLVNGGSYVFDKYGAVSSWNLVNNTLAGVNLGEDWVVSITAKDVSSGATSTNTDNTASFDKSLKVRTASLFTSGTGELYGTGFFRTIPNGGFVWDSDISFELDSIVQPDIPLNSYILSNARGLYLYPGITNIYQEFLLSGQTNTFIDFVLPKISCVSNSIERTGSTDYGGNYSGIDTFIASPNSVSIRMDWITRSPTDIPVDFWEVWISNSPAQDPLLGSNLINIPNPSNLEISKPTVILTDEGQYDLLSRHLTGAVVGSYSSTQVTLFSI